MKVNVLFYSVNDELYDVSLQATMGPYDYVQMTYETLRDDTGQTIAAFDMKEGDWQLTERQPIEGSQWANNVPTGTHYSDFDIIPAEDTDMRDLATRYPRLLRAMKWVAVLSDGEALACLRDYKAGLAYSGEAVNHFGGTRRVIERASRAQVRALFRDDGPLNPEQGCDICGERTQGMGYAYCDNCFDDLESREEC